MFDYSFAAARTAALESSLITKDALSRFTASGVGEAVKQLSAAGYGLPESKDGEELVDGEMSKVRAFLTESLPEELYSLLLLPYDCHNLKILLKSRVSGADVSAMLYDNTLFDADIAAACCRGGEFSLLSENIAAVLNPAFDSGELDSPFGISSKCDLAFYSEIALRAKDAPEIVRKYTEAEADHKNYISFLRAKSNGFSADNFIKTLLPGGEIPAEVFRAAYAADASDIRSYTFGYGAHEAISAAQERASSVTEALDVLDGYSQKLLEAEKYEINSPAPIFLYYKKKAREARLIREFFAKLQEALWKKG